MTRKKLFFPFKSFLHFQKKHLHSKSTRHYLHSACPYFRSFSFFFLSSCPFASFCNILVKIPSVSIGRRDEKEEKKIDVISIFRNVLDKRPKNFSFFLRASGLHFLYLFLFLSKRDESKAQEKQNQLTIYKCPISFFTTLKSADFAVIIVGKNGFKKRMLF